MIGLNRDLAPISEKAWERLEGEARDVLELHLAARKLEPLRDAARVFAAAEDAAIFEGYADADPTVNGPSERSLGG